MSILITSASGKTARHLIPVLLARDLCVRAFVHSANSGAALQEFLNSEGVDGKNLELAVGDLMSAGDIEKAMTDVKVVFHVGPGMTPYEAHMGYLVVDAARRAGVRHFIYCSVLHPNLSKLLNHDIKRHVEEYLIESELNYTILQPTHFLDNNDVIKIVKAGGKEHPGRVDVLQGCLALDDLAEVATKIILDTESHNRATYELCGENKTYTEIASVISAVSGKDISFHYVPFDKLATKSGMKEKIDFQSYDRQERMWFYYDTRGIPGNSNVLRWLLGREPTSVEAWVKKQLEK